MNYWLHRISHEAATSRPLLEKGFLTIGFHALSNDAFLGKAMEAKHLGELDSDVIEAYGQRLRSRHSLWRFLRGMRNGDLILVPDQGTFSVYVIKSEPKLVAEIAPTVHEKGIDLGFYREVEVHRINGTDETGAKEISRRRYADGQLTDRMKMRQTNGDISDLASSVQDALKAFGEQRAPTLNEDIDEITAKQLSGAIYERLSSDKFESLLKWYFERLGGNAHIPPRNEPGKEGDCDVIASFESLRLVIYVQAKRHDPNSPTGDWAVKQIGRYAEWKEDDESSDVRYTTALWVVSTGKCFTKACRAQAEEAGVVLINGIELARMLLHTGVEGLQL